MNFFPFLISSSQLKINSPGKMSEEADEAEKAEEMSSVSNINNVWESYIDETSGETYYYNILTAPETLRTLWSRHREQELENLSSERVLSEIVNVLHENDGKGRGRYALLECTKAVWKEWFEESGDRVTNHVSRYIRSLDNNNNNDKEENVLNLLRKLGLYKLTIKQVQEEFRDREMSNRGVFRWLRETRERSDRLSEVQRSVQKRGQESGDTSKSTHDMSTSNCGYLGLSYRKRAMESDSGHGEM